MHPQECTCRDLTGLVDANSRVMVVIIHSFKSRASLLSLSQACHYPKTIPCPNSRNLEDSLLWLAQKPGCDVPNIRLLQFVILPIVRIDADVVKG